MDVAVYSAEINLSMLALFSSLERREQQWIRWLEETEFEVIKVWAPKTQVVESAVLVKVRKD